MKNDFRTEPRDTTATLKTPFNAITWFTISYEGGGRLGLARLSRSDRVTAGGLLLEGYYNATTVIL